MTAPNDREAAIALFRERFPESEGWSVGMWNDGLSAVASVNFTAREGLSVHVHHARSASDGTQTSLAVADVVWLFDKMQASDPRVRALVEAATQAEADLARIGSALGPWGQHDTRRESAYLLARSLATALAALPASLREKGGGDA